MFTPHTEEMTRSSCAKRRDDGRSDINRSVSGFTSPNEKTSSHPDHDFPANIQNRKKPSKNNPLSSPIKEYDNEIKCKQDDHTLQMNEAVFKEVVDEARSTSTIKGDHKLTNPGKPDNDRKGKMADTKSDLYFRKLLQILDLDDECVGTLVHQPSQETLNKLIQLRTEQEITKQEQLRKDYFATTQELLKLATSSNVSPDLVPLLCLQQESIEDLKLKIAKLGLKEKSSIDFQDIKNITRPSKVNRSLPIEREFDDEKFPPRKRRHSESRLLPSFTEAMYTSRNHPQTEKLNHISSRGSISPTKRGSLDSEVNSNEKLSPSSSYLQKLPPIFSIALSNLHPICYTPSTQVNAYLPKRNSADASSPTMSAKQNAPIGSPYMQTFNPYAYLSFQKFPNTAGGPFHLQQQQYSYYMTSSPSHPMMPCVIPSSGNQSNVVPFVSPNSLQQSFSKDQQKRSKEKPEEPDLSNSTNKKHRQATHKANHINFMITTPRNPPAKRYNKDK